jgi:hypothetical protein
MLASCGFASSAAATNDATNGRRSCSFQASTRRLGGASITGTHTTPTCSR